MKIKTSELEGAALDWAVAYALNGSTAFFDAFGAKMLGRSLAAEVIAGNIKPSTDWCQGGPILEKEQIEMEWVGVDGLACGWNAWHQDVAEMQCGPTMLIAACRAIVSANLGDTVDVPEELV